MFLEGRVPCRIFFFYSFSQLSVNRDQNEKGPVKGRIILNRNVRLIKEDGTKVGLFLSIIPNVY